MKESQSSPAGPADPVTDPFDRPPPSRRPSRPPSGSPPDIRASLPALYRSGDGPFGTLAAVAVEAIGRVAGEIREAAAELEGPSRPAGPDPADGGTEKALIRFFGARQAVPAIWPGVAVVPTGDAGVLEVRPRPAPAAVIAWPVGSEPVPLPEVPAALLPVAVALQAVRLAGPPPDPAIAGDRFAGEILG